MSTNFYRGYNTGTTAEYVYSNGRVYHGPTAAGSPFLSCETSGGTCRIHENYNTGTTADATFYNGQMYHGPNGRAYLAKKMKRSVKPLWVLKRSVDQKPRPWWPEDAELEAATMKFFEDNF